MMDRIRKFQILNNQIFSVLDKYLSGNKAHEPVIVNISPPIPEMVETEQHPRPISVMVDEVPETGSEA